ncbi:phage tail protein [Nitratireductor sp. CAU 1489]|uniref:Phage tail protein n=1 Tax=Nitratireductor arenosus TaxID=2682096 RepID=A0A844QEU7_9HYPH|nr:phage tail protein [Nitratireductor arenosus]MVA96550.1 phage tail protein [Nitratireductor arenosus]
MTIDLEPDDVKRDGQGAAKDTKAGASASAGKTAADKPGKDDASTGAATPVDSGRTASAKAADDKTASVKTDDAGKTGARDKTAAKSDEGGKGGPKSATPEHGTTGAAPAGKTGEARAFGRDGTATVKPAPGGGTPPPAKSDEKPKRRGSLSLVGAGLIGGIVVLAGAGGLQYAGLLPAPGAAQPEDGALDTIRAELAALRQEVEAGAGQGQGAAAEALAAAEAQIEELSGRLQTLSEQVATIQSSIASGGAGEEAALQTLDARLKALEETVAGLADGSGMGQPPPLDALNERLAALDAALAKANEAVARAEASGVSNAEKLAAIETEIAALTERVDAQAANPKIALAIAAAGLKSAIDRGVPFMTELETYAAIAPDTPEIAALRALAATGVPTRAQIERELGDAANRMVAAAAPADADAGFFERLLASLQSLVKVRPIGEVEGEGAGPTVARLESAIRAGDYEKALAEFATLPDPVKAAGADFIAKVEARHTADTLVEKALSGALRA